MQNGLNQSFWDGLGVEIEACANLKKKLAIREMFSDSEFSLEICAWPNLDAKSVPEALV